MNTAGSARECITSGCVSTLHMDCSLRTDPNICERMKVFEVTNPGDRNVHRQVNFRCMYRMKDGIPTVFHNISPVFKISYCQML